MTSPPQPISNCLPCQQETHHTPSSHQLLSSQPTIRLTSALHFLLAVFFCYSIALPVFFTPPSPPCTVWRKVYGHDVVSHPESRTKTCEEMFAGCVSLTHCSLTSSFLQPRWFLPNVIKLFSRPPKPVLFTPVRGRSGGYSSQI